MNKTMVGMKNVCGATRRCRADVFTLPDQEHRRAREAYETRNFRHANHDDGGEKTASARGSNSDGEEDCRKGKRYVNNALNNPIESLVEAADRANHHPDRETDEHRTKPNRERVTPAPEDATEDVSPQLIRA